MGPRVRSACAAGLIVGGLWVGGVSATASAETADTESSANPAGSGARSDDPPHVNRAPTADDPPARRGIGTKWRRADRAERVVRGRDREPSDPCCDDGGKDCGPGWPWPPDDPEPPGIPAPPESHGGVSDRPVVAPRPGGIGTPGASSPQTRPPIELPFDPDVIDVVPGVGLPTTGAGAPISLPVLPVVTPAVAGAGIGAPRAVEAASPPAAPPRIAPESPPARPVQPGENVLAGSPPPAPTRVGYGETLRTAGTSQLAALALPGVVGILVLTAAGSVVGYRQAKAGQAVRARDTARFMN